MASRNSLQCRRGRWKYQCADVSALKTVPPRLPKEAVPKLPVQQRRCLKAGFTRNSFRLLCPSVHWERERRRPRGTNLASFSEGLDRAAARPCTCPNLIAGCNVASRIGIDVGHRFSEAPNEELVQETKGACPVLLRQDTRLFTSILPADWMTGGNQGTPQRAGRTGRVSSPTATSAVRR